MTNEGHESKEKAYEMKGQHKVVQLGIEILREDRSWR
jgi:hypothetical protein